jgi:hypothetical protein
VHRRLLVALIASLLTAAPAAAGTIVVRLTFVPGKLVVRSAPMTATPRSDVQVPVTVADGRGNGTGWTLRVAASHTLRIKSIRARCATGSTCTLPTAMSGPDGKVILRAARGTGMGVIDLVVTVAALPSGTAATALAFTAS